MKAGDIEMVIEKVQAGDQVAYGAVVRAYQHELWRVASYALRSQDETEDLVQQAFVVAYQQLDRYERGRDFPAWLRGIARNLVRERVRQRSREDQRMRRYLTYLEAQAPHDAAADAREVALRAALRTCRDDLSEPSRRALAARYDGGQDFSEVASAIGRTVAGARQLLQRARLQLRQCIEGKLA